MTTLRVLSLGFGAALFATPALAQVTVNGDMTGDNYGPAAAVQSVQTEFGDNMSELDAAYATVDAGKLYVMLTGNIEANFNKYCIFIDSKPGGENVFSGTPGNDNSGVMAGLTFDAGFEADYFIICRRGFSQFDVDIAELGTPNFSSYIDALGGLLEGAGATGTGPGNATPVEFGYNNSNIAGIAGGTLAADPNAALAVDTGLELGIDLADLGNPSGTIKICAFVNGSNLDFASNQFLGGLAAPQANLGGDGNGNFSGLLSFDLGTFAGDQFFCVGGSIPVGVNYCGASVNDTGGPALISGSGSASVAAGDLVLSCGPVGAGQPGIFFFSDTAAANPNGVPFGEGARCVIGSIVRILPPVFPDVNGFLNRPVDASAFSIASGQTLYFQGWYRDSMDNDGDLIAEGFNLSDGLEIVFVP